MSKIMLEHCAARCEIELDCAPNVGYLLNDLVIPCLSGLGFDLESILSELDSIANGGAVGYAQSYPGAWEEF